jgi:hypothetical protein
MALKWNLCALFMGLSATVGIVPLIALLTTLFRRLPTL